MSDQPFIAIVILNYNQIEVTCEFIDSCKNLDYKNYRIVLVDNASENDPSELIKVKYPEVQLIRNAKNLGFTGGNNVGINSIKADYYFIVNNDTEVTPSVLKELLLPFQEDESLGMVSPKIRYFEKPDVIQYAGYSKINPFTGRNQALGGKEFDRGQHDRPGYTNYAHGAAMLVKAELINKIGAFADIFFIYYEELDWSARAVRAGYKIYYQPTAVIFHKESITMGKESAMKAYYHNRNRVLFMKRNTSLFQFFIFSIFFLFIVTPKQILKYTVNSQKEHLKNYFKALKWNIRNYSVKY
ncbi:MAG: glycosyltransferase family 2 protein [Bacteroidota bacterium]